jgi:hypothetical protein
VYRLVMYADIHRKFAQLDKESKEAVLATIRMMREDRATFELLRKAKEGWSLHPIEWQVWAMLHPQEAALEAEGRALVEWPRESACRRKLRIPVYDEAGGEIYEEYDDLETRMQRRGMENCIDDEEFDDQFYDKTYDEDGKERGW